MHKEDHLFPVSTECDENKDNRETTKNPPASRPTIDENKQTWNTNFLEIIRR
jgi:hypothetical protein